MLTSSLRKFQQSSSFRNKIKSYFMAPNEMPLLVVFGATGSQGHSVISALRASHSSEYHIRGLTSNKASDAARELSRNGIEVVQVDMESETSIQAALEGAEAVFANTAFPVDVFISQGEAAAEDAESKAAMRIARAVARVTTLKHLVWSTLPDASKKTGGKLYLHHFQSKVPAVQFIRSEPDLAKKTTMLSVGMYGSNLKNPGYVPIYDVSSDSEAVATLADCTSDIYQEIRCEAPHPPRSLLFEHRKRTPEHWRDSPSYSSQRREELRQMGRGRSAQNDNESRRGGARKSRQGTARK